MAKPRKEKCHFTVDPDGFTERVREFWTEGRTGFALKLLIDGMGMSLEQALSVATGAQKLISDDGINFGLAKDDAKVTSIVQMRSVVDLLDRLDSHEKELKKFSKIKFFAPMIHACAAQYTGGRKASMGTPVGLINPKYAIQFLSTNLEAATDEEYQAFWDHHAEEVRDDIAFGFNDPLPQAEPTEEGVRAPIALMQEKLDKQESRDHELASQWSKHTATDVDVYLAHQRELEQMDAPGPDFKLESHDGWVLPNGNFYPCRYMEHIWLADKLKGLEEKDAERAGWIKISDSLTGIHIYKGEKKPTQKQINTVFDWCEKHKHSLPDWAGGKDE